MQSYFPIVWALIPLLKFPYIHNELKIKTKDQDVSAVIFVSKVSKSMQTDWTRKWRTDDETKVGLKFLCQEFCSMILQRMTRVDTSKQGFRMEGWKSSDDSVVKWKEMDSIMALVLPMFDDPQLFLSTSLSTSSSSS